MSGYSTKAEAMETLKGTIKAGNHILSTNPKDYYMERIFQDTFNYQGPTYRWHLNSLDSTDLHKSMFRHMRPAAKARLGEQQEQARREHEATNARCLKETGHSLEHYLSN